MKATTKRARSRLGKGAVLSLLGLGLLAGCLWKPPILYNTTASIPVGLYLRTMAEPEAGSVVAACVPETVAAFARLRRYVARSWRCPGQTAPVMKRVVAVEGAWIEADGARIWIDGVPQAQIRSLDSTGRPLPRLQGVKRLQKGELFLLGDALRSFDSRYFGPVEPHQVLGRFRPLWVRPLDQADRP